MMFLYKIFITKMNMGSIASQQRKRRILRYHKNLECNQIMQLWYAYSRLHGVYDDTRSTSHKQGHKVRNLEYN